MPIVASGMSLLTFVAYGAIDYLAIDTQLLQRCILPDTPVMTKSNIPAFRQHVALLSAI
jgi:hypothetical protein